MTVSVTKQQELICHVSGRVDEIHSCNLPLGSRFDFKKEGNLADRYDVNIISKHIGKTEYEGGSTAKTEMAASAKVLISAASAASAGIEGSVSKIAEEMEKASLNVTTDSLLLRIRVSKGVEKWLCCCGEESQMTLTVLYWPSSEPDKIGGLEKQITELTSKNGAQEIEVMEARSRGDLVSMKAKEMDEVRQKEKMVLSAPSSNHTTSSMTATHEPIQSQRLSLQSYVHGKLAWFQYLGVSVENEATLPEDIIEMLEGVCPFSSRGKKIWETHALLLIPPVKERWVPLDLLTLGIRAKKRADINITVTPEISEGQDEKCETFPYWVLILKESVPLDSIDHVKRLGYQTPSILQVTMFKLMEFQRMGTSSPFTARCSEEINEEVVVVTMDLPNSKEWHIRPVGQLTTRIYPIRLLSIKQQ